MPEDATNSLNPNHVRRLRVTCRHIDKLLSDMEGALNASASRVAFPQYVSDIAPAQRRIIEDYITRIRAQLVRVLDGQAIERPAADIPVSRSLHAVLTFIDIAVEELKPEYMRGYGEVPAAAATELNGIAGELRGLVNQLNQYVTRGSKEDLQRGSSAWSNRGRGRCCSRNWNPSSPTTGWSISLHSVRGFLIAWKTIVLKLLSLDGSARASRLC